MEQVVHLTRRYKLNKQQRLQNIAKQQRCMAADQQKLVYRRIPIIEYKVQDENSSYWLVYN